MTVTIRPRTLAHHGVVKASALLFDPAIIGESECRRRILALWTPGVQVVRLRDGALLLRLSACVHIDCAHAPGAPLTTESGLLLSAPLTQAERHGLDAPAGALVVLRGGAAVVVPPDDGRAEDLSDWLLIGEWQNGRMESLGAPPVQPRDVAAPQPFNPRARLAGVPQEAPERASVIAALRKAAEARSGTGLTAVAPKPVSGPAGWLGRFALRVLGGTTRPQAPARNVQATPNDTLRWLAARLALVSGLAGVIGRRQADYIQSMIEMFERGDLHEALRHAIAMDEVDGRPKPPALGVPRPRDSLTIAPAGAPAGASIGLGADLRAHMEALYRQAFRKLDAEGRVEEAAFVLAELLGANEEAVNFLERHRRLTLAAEIAEGRGLAPDLVVRLWFLAGDRERAAAIARRTGAFSGAVLRMERTDWEKAGELRRIWAESLADADNNNGALQVIEPLWETLRQDPEMKAKILRWMERGIALRGVAGAEALVRKLTLLPEADPETRMQALTLLEEDEAETAGERLAFARALTRPAVVLPMPMTRTLMRAAVRAVLRDVGMGTIPLERKELAGLAHYADDSAMSADLPSLPSSPRIELSKRDTPLQIVVNAGDGGVLAIHDAAFLPTGHSVVALGEAGVRLLTRDGRIITHLDEPTYRLVISDRGGQALALAPRGDLWRIAKLDFVARRSTRWQDATLCAFAADYDGSLWFAAARDQFFALDALAPGLDALWRLPRLEGRIDAIARDADHCAFVMTSMGVTDPWGKPTEPWIKLERWVHRLPLLSLSERTELPLPLPDVRKGQDYFDTLTASGTVFRIGIEPALPADAAGWSLTLSDLSRSAQVVDHFLDRPNLLPPALGGGWALLSTADADGVTCRLLHANPATSQQNPWTLCASLRLGGATQLSARFTAQHLTLADDRGRFLVLDLQSGLLIRDLRLR